MINGPELKRFLEERRRKRDRGVSIEEANMVGRHKELIVEDFEEDAALHGPDPLSVVNIFAKQRQGRTFDERAGRRYEERKSLTIDEMEARPVSDGTEEEEDAYTEDFEEEAGGSSARRRQSNDLRVFQSSASQSLPKNVRVIPRKEPAKTGVFEYS